MDTGVKPAYDGLHDWRSALRARGARLFFLLSKTLGIMLLPTNLLIGVGLVGVVLLATRLASLGRKLLIASVLLLAICGFSPLGNLVLYPLESRFPPWDAAQGAPDGIVVLGGSIDADVSAAHGVAVVGSGADRIFAAAALAHRYPKARLIFTGGSGNLISNDAREADYVAAMFESLGISSGRLVMERRSRNTQENAEFSMAMANPKPGERWLLVTSAFHMPRSVGVFRTAGFAVQPYPVDWRVGRGRDVLRFNVSLLEGLGRVDTGMREWMGLIAYWATGRTDALLPGPASN